MSTTQRSTAASLALLALMVASSAVPSVSAAAARLKRENPIPRVVELLENLKRKITDDGKNEGVSYDEFACWCEKTLARKASEIESGKERIEEFSQSIVKLKGNLGSHGAEIKQLNSDIAANKESQREAKEVREREAEEYISEKMESEQCVGALEAAINVLTGAGVKKRALGTLQEAQLLSVVAGIRGVLGQHDVSHSLSDGDLQLVKRFVARPEEFVHKASGMVSAVQLAQNPFGDYAPRSTRIQGVLKGMYDAFASDLEKANAQEAGKVKAYNELMETKRLELKTLELTLQRQSADEATKQKDLVDSETDREDAKQQLEADEKMFADTKKSCKKKAKDWAARTRLRTEELTGINQAITILSSPEAQVIFESAHNSTRTPSNSGTFVDLGNEPHLLRKLLAPKRPAKQLPISRKKNPVSGHSFDALLQIVALAKPHASANLAQVANVVKAGGHFDKVIIMIDRMIRVLRDEGLDDIAHRDRCQAKQTENAHNKEDLNHDITKISGEIDRANNTVNELKEEKAGLEIAINATSQSLDELRRMRTQEYDAFVQGLEDDANAINLISLAIKSLSRFYAANKVGLKLVQRQDPANPPEDTEDDDKAPETIWQGADYRGSHGESGGVIAILSMIKEDLEKEIVTSRQADAVAQVDYDADRTAHENDLRAQNARKADIGTKLAYLGEILNGKQQKKSQKGDDLAGEDQVTEALEQDCGWVETHFESRREKRKAEMDALVDAKNYLKGVDTGANDEIPTQG